MARNFTPASDADFDLWLANYNAALAAHYSEVGLTSNDVDATDATKLIWDEKFSANNTVRSAWHQAVAAKIAARDAMETLLAPQVARIQSFPGTTDELRQAFGLKPKSASTPSTEMPHDDKPKPEIDRNELLTHNVTVYTLTSEGVQSRKPAGTMGCEVRRKIGAAPASPEEMEVVGVMPGTKFSIKYPGTEVGKQVTYAMRWIAKDGSPGTWSDFQSATIAA